MRKRAFIIVIDGVGVGEMPDADNYGDKGSDTLGNLATITGGLHLPTLKAMGLGCLHPVKGITCVARPGASYGKMAEASAGKDSTTGHWELAGLLVKDPFPTYPHGFPVEILDRFTQETGLKYLGNYAASGTEIIKELGEAHLQTGSPIIYTSADSVFQIAAHEEIIPLERLYKICLVARKILNGKDAVARVIARPFLGNSRQDFYRTKNRKDFSLKPQGRTILSILFDAGIPTIAIGKINDLYAYDGISQSIQTKTNEEGMQTLSMVQRDIREGMIMANLVDFDMLWGHRNDPVGFKNGLEIFDHWLGPFLSGLTNEDICIITADHGNDPTTPSTDHSREYVPLLVTGPQIKKGVNLGVRKTFADCQASLASYFRVEKTDWGISFLEQVLIRKVQEHPGQIKI
jgi:phosphopentomutase